MSEYTFDTNCQVIALDKICIVFAISLIVTSCVPRLPESFFVIDGVIKCNESGNPVQSAIVKAMLSKDKPKVQDFSSIRNSVRSNDKGYFYYLLKFHKNIDVGPAIQPREVKWHLLVQAPGHSTRIISYDSFDEAVVYRKSISVFLDHICSKH